MKKNRMHKPLSASLYILKNPRKSVNIMIAMGISVVLIMISQMLFYSVVEGPRLSNSTTNIMSELHYAEPIEKSLYKTNKFSNEMNIEKVLVMKSQDTDYFHFFGAANAKVYSVGESDIEYVLMKMNMQLVEGKLPTKSDEIVLDTRLAKNKGKALGDLFGKGVDSNEKLYGKYIVVGLIEGPYMFGVKTLSTQESNVDSIAIFPKDQKMNQMNAHLKDEISDKDILWTKEMAEKDYQESYNTIYSLSVFPLLGIIFVMAFATGNQYFSQYLSRKYEFGLLQAIGLTKKEIVVKAVQEILIQGSMGIFVGVIVGLLTGVLLEHFYFLEHGYPFQLMQSNTIVEIGVIWICTFVFGIIPVNSIVGKVDAISILEKND